MSARAGQPREAASSTEPSTFRLVGSEVGHLWWVPLATGVLSIGFGLAVMATDWTVRALVVAAGLLLVVRGVGLAFNPSYAEDGASEQVVAGVVGIIAGVVLIAWPEPTLLVLAVVLGGWLALSGAFHVVSCVARRHHMRNWGWGVAIGVLELLLGVWAMRRPEVTLSLLVTVIGLWAVLTGVLQCVLAFEVRAAVRQLDEPAAPRTVDLREPSRPVVPAGPDGP